MEKKTVFGVPQRLFVFFCFIAVFALAGGLVDGVLSNYFKEVYNADAAMRGFIEFPRELPGILSIFILGALSFLGDVRSSIVAMCSFVVGAVCLGFFTPPFGVMLIFVFLNSVGTHMFMPLSDGIGIGLIDNPEQAGKRIGQYSGVKTAFQLVAAVIVFFSFRFGIFSFDTKIKWVFVATAVVGLAALGLSIYLSKISKLETSTQKKFRIVLKKEYRFYYALCTLSGAQKQIMLVYGPWVLIEMLGAKADTLALLTIISSFIGIFFIQAIGRWIDKFGIRRVMYLDAFSFVFVYLAYGFLTKGFVSGTIAKTGIFVILTMGLFILDRMSMQFSIVRTAYLRNISTDPGDITATISAGISLDHIVSIICASLCGFIWVQFGAQYIFFGLAALSVFNVIIAGKAHINNEN